MKRKLFIFVALLFLAAGLLFSQSVREEATYGIDEDISVAIAIEYASDFASKSELRDMPEQSGQLVNVGIAYVEEMMYTDQVTHNLMTWSQREDFIREGLRTLQSNGYHEPNLLDGNWIIEENLSFTPWYMIDSYWDIHKAWEGSPDHWNSIYHPDNEWFAYVVGFTDDGAYAAVYVARRR